MSGQRSDWRERLHANPSRMEQELAIKLQDDGIQSKSLNCSWVPRRKPRVWEDLVESSYDVFDL